MRDQVRIERTAQGLIEAELDCLICALPDNVLLLSGYWPIVGTAIAAASADGRVAMVVPEDEKTHAQAAGAADLFTFAPGSLERIYQAVDVVADPLQKAMTALGIPRDAAVGYEAGAWHAAASYIAMNFYGCRMSELIHRAAPSVKMLPADALLKQWRSVLTPLEIDHLRTACRIAQSGFDTARQAIVAGVAEREAAARARFCLADPQVFRSDGHIAVMSGVRSARAYGSFAVSSDKKIAAGDLVLTHCNSQADGYWTDITRTFCVGNPSARQREMYDAVLAARGAALAAIGPGAKAADVDRAARKVMEDAGFGKQFRHPTGHGVGFAAIDHDAIPRIHPVSPDILREGMVFNIEPAVYIEETDGLRHCDMVAVTSSGYELLTAFLADPV